MFEDTSLFGISMARRTNRRWLVLLTYAFTAAVIAGSIAMAHVIAAISGPSFLRSTMILLAWLPVFVVQILIPGSGRYRGIFGRFVPEQTFSFYIPAVQTLGVTRSVNQSTLPQVDEREKSVRNFAYFLAFKIVAWYSLVFLVTCVASIAGREDGMPRAVTAVAAIPIVVMLFTLPQAIILWSEPDLPGNRTERES